MNVFYASDNPLHGYLSNQGPDIKVDMVEIDSNLVKYKEDRSSFFTRYDVCWKYYPNVAWSIEWYFGIRGAECLHLYLWVIKDLSW